MSQEKDNIEKNFSIKKMPKKQRYSFYFLVFLSVGIISLWFWQYNYNLKKNFQPQSSGDVKIDELKQTEDDFISSIFDDAEFIDERDFSFANEPLLNPDDEYRSETDLSNIMPFLPEPKMDEEILLSGRYEELFLKALSGDVDPESLRELLIIGGLDEEIVYQLSDEDLNLLYEETFSELIENQEISF